MKRILLGMVMVMIAGSANAATIASWDLTGLTGTITEVAGTGTENVSAYDMEIGGGLTSAGFSVSQLTAAGWDGTDVDDYVELGISVADGYEAALDTLYIGTMSSLSGPGSIGVFTSDNDYSSPLLVIEQIALERTYTEVDLSSIVVSGDFFIRLYEDGNSQAGDGGETTASNGILSVFEYSNDLNVSIDGKISPVPVPGAIWLLASGLTAAAVSRRRRKR